MHLNNYETVFILTPVLSDEQIKDTVEKFQKILADNGAEIVHVDHWGMKKLAYPIKKKTSGVYTVVEFKAPSTIVKALETEYRRDERVMRHICIVLDKHAVAYNEKKRRKLSDKKVDEAATTEEK
ncbi:30S ribosomal protein S6 [Microscilla marina]|uniref:Small ribosomal subunit protein bS6 n=1 Tax=Microscilla marina ATCC 23134 TaxID=313606 RepID=A1ZXM5_MICM2|nr:30S ribosomal protein S6 [Microscilla marina]EAY24900.1 ribosomal protein S6 [Microscilla marina ATCC 23134]